VVNSDILLDWLPRRQIFEKQFNMKKTPIFLLASMLCSLAPMLAQDTFSIVAVDSITGEVGSAGASCISADNLAVFFPNDDPDFLGDLLPGRGAINTQSAYNATNQQNANDRLSDGDTPQQVVDWLAANDAQGNSSNRQYGVAALQGGQAMAAGFTGADCFDWKGHRVGPNYAIQGNILLGPEILDSMEARFLNTPGCLSEKLMAAMQGAKVPGADTRCLNNGTSAMFAFLKVARPDDDPADPFLRIFVAYNPDGTEPIDSLQARFDEVNPCASNVGEKGPNLLFTVSPNPSSGSLVLQYPAAYGPCRLDVLDVQGKKVAHWPAIWPGEMLHLDKKGLLLLQLTDRQGRVGVKKVELR
jgi:uncharacterized Ntn-hydrolase superfamily protein